MAYKVKLPPIREGIENTLHVSPIPEKVVIPVIYEAEQPAPAPVTPKERQADLDVEEALFRLYWKTLPDKVLARETWPSELRWYCQQKGLEVMEELGRRCQDLKDAP